ncbi:MAG: glycogen debranching protein GlgX [Luteitalea sp.]|nr:glycogen debranching protein GlgX [Luteitalea sp.]
MPTDLSEPASERQPVRSPAPVRIWRGEPSPLGAHWDGIGTNFSVFSEVATRVELCLFGADGSEERFDLPEQTALCWHGYLPGIGPGQRYGFRVHGPWDPANGHRCNPAKLLLDPYARAIAGDVRWDPAVFPYAPGSPQGDEASADDSGPFVPRSIVIDPQFDWGDDRPIRRPLDETVIYEAHVKGFSVLCADIPEAIRGTYAGLAHPAAIGYLTRLGITAVELLPVHQFVHDSHLLERGLRNYWGYNSIGFFAPHGDYSSGGDGGGQVIEFKQMVKALHAAGLEVILDVVYNHTGEGNHLGPMLSLKGFDNAAYYRTREDDRRLYLDYTGTGNSLSMRQPQALQLVMDSLRYWTSEMHVDGFRFDLAATLARELYDVDRLSAFFDIIHQDPLLNRVKLIAEPWDLGMGGYQVGNFPVLWCEWNGKYRDTVRDYWRSQERTLGEFAARLTGSSDLYQDDGRKPYASVNFITAHDGFTLNDLVSYSDKHNQANGEESRDGESHNRSWNLGVEGPTDDPTINRLRARQKRNFLATLLLSQGVPMLLGGDESGRTQQGNNNAYGQDNEISWFDWSGADTGLEEFTRRVIAFRRDHPVFRRRGWFKEHAIHCDAVRDIAWLKPDAGEMTDEDWTGWPAKSFMLFLSGDHLAPDAKGRAVQDDSFCLVFNAHLEQVTFTMPGAPWGSRWAAVIETARDDAFPEHPLELDGGASLERPRLSLVVLRRIAPTSPSPIRRAVVTPPPTVPSGPR